MKFTPPDWKHIRMWVYNGRTPKGAEKWFKRLLYEIDAVEVKEKVQFT